MILKFKYLIFLFFPTIVFSQGTLTEFCNIQTKRAELNISRGNYEFCKMKDTILNDDIKYYIWKKYNIIVFQSPTIPLPCDSCYDSKMKTIFFDKIPQINHDIDSLLKVNKDLRYHFDGVRYLSWDRPVYIEKGRSLKSMVDSLEDALSYQINDTAICEFFYEIDSNGNPINFEIYRHISPEIDSTIKDFFMNLTWIPAKENDIVFNFRLNNYILLFGKKK